MSSSASASPLPANEPTPVPKPILPKATPSLRHPLYIGKGVSTYLAKQEPTHAPEHSHEQLQIVVQFEPAVCSVTALNEQGEKTQSNVVGRQVWLIAPGVVHEVEWQEVAEVVIFHIELAFLREIASVEIPRFIARDFASLAGDDFVVWQLAALFRSLCRHDEKPNSLYVESIGTVMATHLIRNQFPSGNQRLPDLRGLSPRRLQQVIHHIQENIQEKLSVDDLARKVGMSPYHFSRLFKISVGMPPHEYVMRCKTKKAIELLRTGEYQISEVAFEAGFCDQGHLNRNFHKFGEKPPSQFLKQDHP
jgi:AraC family transcriptional regulator